MLERIRATDENAAASLQLLFWYLLQHGVPEQDALKLADHNNKAKVTRQNEKLSKPSFLPGKEGRFRPSYYGVYSEDKTALLALAKVSINVPRASIWQKIRHLRPGFSDEDNISMQIHSLAYADTFILDSLVDELVDLARALGVRQGDNPESEVGEIRASILENPEILQILQAKGFELKRRRARKIRLGKTVLYFSDFVRKKHY